MNDTVRVNFSKSDGFELAINTDAPTLVFLDPPFETWYPYSWRARPNRLVEPPDTKLPAKTGQQWLDPLEKLERSLWRIEG